MGRDVRHQVLRGALSVKVHVAMIAVRDLLAPWCVKVYVKSQTPGLAHTPIP